MPRHQHMPKATPASRAPAQFASKHTYSPSGQALPKVPCTTPDRRPPRLARLQVCTHDCIVPKKRVYPPPAVAAQSKPHRNTPIIARLFQIVPVRIKPRPQPSASRLPLVPLLLSLFFCASSFVPLVTHQHVIHTFKREAGIATPAPVISSTTLGVIRPAETMAKLFGA